MPPKKRQPLTLRKENEKNQEKKRQREDDIENKQAEKLRKRNQREDETAQETSCRKEADKQSHKVTREEETAHEKLARNEQNRLNMAAKRQNDRNRQSIKVKPTYRIAMCNTTIREEDVVPFSCGSMNVECSECHSFNFAGEMTKDEKQQRFSMCCQKGKVKLPDLHEPPQLLKTLLDGNTTVDKNYQNFILNFNSAIAFASRKAFNDESMSRIIKNNFNLIFNFIF